MLAALTLLMRPLIDLRSASHVRRWYCGLLLSTSRIIWASLNGGIYTPPVRVATVVGAPLAACDDMCAGVKNSANVCQPLAAAPQHGFFVMAACGVCQVSFMARFVHTRARLTDAAYPSSVASLAGLSRLRFLVSGEGDALGDLESEAGIMQALCAGAHHAAVRCWLHGFARLCKVPNMANKNDGSETFNHMICKQV